MTHSASLIADTSAPVTKLQTLKRVIEMSEEDGNSLASSLARGAVSMQKCDVAQVIVTY